MKALVTALAVALAAVHAPSAHAEPTRPAEPTELIGTQPLALVARGVSMTYERLVLPRTSVVALGGLRAAAEGDYSSRTWTAGAELRIWPLSYEMRRLFVGVHASAGRTSLADDVMQTAVGTSWTLTQRVDVGYRFVAWRHLALAPSLGLAVREDIDGAGRLATTAHPAIVLGFELGWMR